MSVSNLLKKSSQVFLDVVFPPYCVSCKTTGQWLCENCLNLISLVTNSFCQQCGTPLPTGHSDRCQRCCTQPLKSIDGIRAAAHFEKTPIREAIHALKYENHRALPGILSQLLAEAYRRFGLKADTILPIPLHHLRHKERGYNQSELLAKELGEKLGLPVNCRSLKRTRHTKVQVDLPAVERYQNVAEAFFCSDRELSEQRVLLVDDVCTTGATMDACAAALKLAGVKSVWGLALARASISS